VTQPFSIYEVGADAILPPAETTVSQWADENRRLSGTASAEKGQWHTRPFQREPMDTLSSGHPCRKSVWMCAAQTLKTEGLLNFLGYITDIDPGPVLVVEPRIEDAKALSKDRVAPMLKFTPCLKGKVADVKSRDSDNTTLHKAFTNGAGHITFAGAISPSGLAMRPIRYLLMDEVDRYPVSAGTEGNPMYLAIRRTDEFEWNKKILICSTPTVKGDSNIEREWLGSDQREWFVPCPFCNELQVLVLGDGSGPGLVWPEGKPKEAKYRCAHCSELIPHHKKAWMEERGEWRAQNPESDIPGFHLSQLHSPKKAWGTVASDFEQAKKSPETLKAFMNTVLAELWEERHDVKLDADGLLHRCEPMGVLPSEVCILTAGVDVQADRLECEVVGWGRDEESWSIAYHVIPGDVTRPEVWAALEEVLIDQYPHESGMNLRIAAAGIDCGYKDGSVLKFTRDRFNRRVYAVKGSSGGDGPIWPGRPSKKNQTRFFVVGVNAAKDSVYDRLKIADPGSGYCHFPNGPNYDLDHFEQLTCEKKYTTYHNGYPKRVWKKPDGARNEAFDTRVYNYVMLHALYAAGMRLDVLADRMETIRRAQRKEPITDTPQARHTSTAPRSRVVGRFRG
jgi:phage terminase large subunit GpA-like protein